MTNQRTKIFFAAVFLLLFAAVMVFAQSGTSGGVEWSWENGTTRLYNTNSYQVYVTLRTGKHVLLAAGERKTLMDGEHIILGASRIRPANYKPY